MSSWVTDLLRLRQKQKEQKERTLARKAGKLSPATIRLQNDITKLALPDSIKIQFPNPNNKMDFIIIVSPTEGYYKNGHFKFSINVNENYPIDPPKVKCTQTIYHPNIDLQGNVCLNILRADWTPALDLNSVVYGLNLLFNEPNPNDPLNKNAANDLIKNEQVFRSNVCRSMEGMVFDNVIFDRVL
ncbi:NEDD8-conjugating protein UBC12 [Ascoidea rubescens DSM 1968]|uniref:NEDD8-conjugating enzyme UBC12 n=1 Tax=Ascoidea rubescens DSM 1968 TaxID=1344418 RepID=A0A1D2VMQ5_9ASCO|nr:NEDD8-conjugating enzyme Ubc12 [Ascoidea rubescens DSM 1968]ODV62892.1 NEDD8-conjugating enzyme Ubc12 [Ascoidea rubescens DSM 1968]